MIYEDKAKRRNPHYLRHADELLIPGLESGGVGS